MLCGTKEKVFILTPARWTPSLVCYYLSPGTVPSIRLSSWRRRWGRRRVSRWLPPSPPQLCADPLHFPASTSCRPPPPWLCTDHLHLTCRRRHIDDTSTPSALDQGYGRATKHDMVRWNPYRVVPVPRCIGRAALSGIARCVSVLLSAVSRCARLATYSYKYTCKHHLSNWWIYSIGPYMIRTG
jgi:hypothetical protein